MNPLDVIGSATDFAKNIVDRIWPKKMNESEKAEAVLEIERLIQAREDTLVSASRDIIVAELQQGDNFTKRARPTITYCGLFVIMANYVVVPFLNRVMEWIAIWKGSAGQLQVELSALNPVELPEMFWIAWGGVVAVYSLGRTSERIAGQNKVVDWLSNGGKK